MQVLLATCYSMNTQFGNFLPCLSPSPLGSWTHSSSLSGLAYFIPIFLFNVHHVWRPGLDVTSPKRPFMILRDLLFTLVNVSHIILFIDLSGVYSTLKNLDVCCISLVYSSSWGFSWWAKKEMLFWRERDTAPRHKCGRKGYWQFRSGTLYSWREGLRPAGHHSLEPPIMERYRSSWKL